MCPARILVADDHDLVREGLRALIHEQPEWELVGEAKDGREAVVRASELRPDIAILDISMPLLDGLDATKEMLKLNPHAKILILTIYDCEQAIERAVNAGARGYILKSDAASDLVLAVRALLNGQTFFTPKAARIILDEFTGNGAKLPKYDATSFTEKKREILRLLSEGRSIKEVAAQLNLSAKTVKSQRRDFMQRFSCRSLGELAMYAVRNHLLEA